MQTNTTPTLLQAIRQDPDTGLRWAMRDYAALVRGIARRTGCAAACTPGSPACAAASAPGRTAQAGEVPGQGNAAPCARQAGTPPAQREPPGIPAIAGSDRPHGR